MISLGRTCLEQRSAEGRALFISHIHFHFGFLYRADINNEKIFC